MLSVLIARYGFETNAHFADLFALESFKHIAPS